MARKSLKQFFFFKHIFIVYRIIECATTLVYNHSYITIKQDIYSVTFRYTTRVIWLVHFSIIYDNNFPNTYYNNMLHWISNNNFSSAKYFPYKFPFYRHSDRTSLASKHYVTKALYSQPITYKTPF